MGPIFNKKLLKSEVCRSRKQCMGPTDVAENCLTSQILRLLFLNSSCNIKFVPKMREKKKKKNADAFCRIQTYT